MCNNANAQPVLLLLSPRVPPKATMTKVLTAIYKIDLANPYYITKPMHKSLLPLLPLNFDHMPPPPQYTEVAYVWLANFSDHFPHLLFPSLTIYAIYVSTYSQHQPLLL